MTKTKHFQNCLGVFQGGGCKASAYVGAYKEAIRWGVSFTELVGTSAGAIVAVLIAAGATPEQLEMMMDDLDFKNFLTAPNKIHSYKPPKKSNYFKYFPSKSVRKYSPILTHLGLFDSIELKKWLNKKLSILLPYVSGPIKFKDLIIPVHVIATDIQSKKIEIFSHEQSSNMDVALAVQYSCNIPLFFQPIDMRYVDGGMLSNLPSFIFANNSAKFYNKILAFSLESSKESIAIDNIFSYSKALLDTVIDGNLDLQLSLQESIHIIRINTGKIKSTDFNSINRNDINVLKKGGEEAVKDFFVNEVANLKNNRNSPDVLLDSFQTNNKITQLLDKKYDEIIIIDNGNDWVYEIFPTLLKWFFDKTKILFISKEPVKNDKHYQFRNRILIQSGVEIRNVENIPFRGFIFDGNSEIYCKAIILSENSRFHSKYYEGETDFHVINLIWNQYKDNFSSNSSVRFAIEKIDNEVLIKEIRKVPQYNKTEVNISVQDLDINILTFITKFIRAYKYRQIETIFNLYKRSDVEFFNPAKLVIDDNKYTLITPPVVEKIGDNCFVIEGNTRLTYAFKNGIAKIKCVVVEGVTEALPSTGRYKIKEIILSDKEVIGEERYDKFDYSRFRKIESSVRNPENCLL